MQNVYQQRDSVTLYGEVGFCAGWNDAKLYSGFDLAICGLGFYDYKWPSTNVAWFFMNAAIDQSIGKYIEIG
jgi:hypothetical protein